MCLLLGDFLRGTLHLSSLERIPLGQELALVDQFLAIEQVRFGERLQLDARDRARRRWRSPSRR